MSNKDVIALADTMREVFETNAGREMDDETRRVLLNHLAWFCADHNGNFQRDRWFDYIAPGWPHYRRASLIEWR